MMDAELIDVPWSKGDVAATPEGQFGSKSIVTLKTGGTKMVHNPSGTNIKTNQGVPSHRHPSLYNYVIEVLSNIHATGWNERKCSISNEIHLLVILADGQYGPYMGRTGKMFTEITECATGERGSIPFPSSRRCTARGPRVHYGQ